MLIAISGRGFAVTNWFYVFRNDLGFAKRAGFYLDVADGTRLRGRGAGLVWILPELSLNAITFS